MRALRLFRAAWAHHSMAIEGNILSLEEATSWLNTEEYTELPYQQYHEAGSQAEALDWLWTLPDRDPEVDDLLNLHAYLLPPSILLPSERSGMWKHRPNGIVYREEDGRRGLHLPIEPEFVPELMKEPVEETNRASYVGVLPGNEHIEFSKLHLGLVNLHPFFECNGRMARMIRTLRCCAPAATR